MIRSIPMTLTVAAAAAMFLSGCGSERSAAMAEGYDQRPALEGTLFPSDQTTIGDDAIRRILDGKVVIADQVMIAVMPLGCGDGGSPGYAGAIQATITERVQREARVLGIERIPTLILSPQRRDIPRIREACARLQCDLVLLYSVRQEVKVHNRLFAKDEAKSFATIEAVLMDVRTGMIPWTDVVDNDITAIQDADHEAWERAVTASVQAATSGMAEDLSRFFAKLPPRSVAPSAPRTD
jgi:hypothetical protein